MPSRLPVLLALAAALCLPPPGAGAQDAPGRYHAWGEETLGKIAAELWLPARGLFAEKAPAGAAPTQPAFLWGAGVQLSALAAAAREEPSRYAAPLRAYADALQVYWTEHLGIGGFDVLPAPKPADRYYDDNVWVVLALVETFEVTGDPAYRDRAEATFRFVMSGEDEKLGGGIYWHEKTRATKNTCSNAPAVVAALRLYQLTGREEYLRAARRLYDWTRARLQDPEDGLFWDNLKLDGEIDRRKYSYNTALMIRADALFHEITGEPRYLEEGRRVALAAQARWLVPETGGVRDGGRFAHMLLESFLALHARDGDPRWPRLVGDALAFVHARVRDPNGRHASRWDRPQAAPLPEFMLLDQASAARAYWVAARELRD